jgi:hypothetical protein
MPRDHKRRSDPIYYGRVVLEAFPQIEFLFETGLQRLSTLLSKDLPTQDLVEVGALLWSVRKQIDQAFGPIKDHIRAEGHERHPGTSPGKIELRGRSKSAATVTFQTSRMNLRKGVDIENLKATLGPDFDRLFQTKTTYTPDKPAIEMEFSTDDSQIKGLLLQALELKPSTARVFFSDLRKK